MYYVEKTVQNRTTLYRILCLMLVTEEKALLVSTVEIELQTI